jgi:carbonic anhydrase
MVMKTVDITYRFEACEVPPRSQPPGSDAALLRLDEGNRAFTALLDGVGDGDGIEQRLVLVDPRDVGLLQGGAAAPGQHPFAAVLGCSDARVPVELIFNEGPNDLFVIRVAGNVLGTEVLGSLRFAVEHLGHSLKLIVVLGHSRCGALTAAVDVFLNPNQYLPLATKHSLRDILDRLLVVIEASARRLLKAFGADVTRHPRYRETLIEVSIITNAALVAYSIQQELGAQDPSGLRTVYGVYLLETREVWAPRIDTTKNGGLAAPPNDPAGFIELGDAIVQSERIASLIRLEK